MDDLVQCAAWCVLSVMIGASRVSVNELTVAYLCADADMLRYPISLLTAAALIEGVLEVLARRYKTAKFDGRGRALKKRDEKSRKKAARKAAHGVRLDIRDVLRISDVRASRMGCVDCC